MDLDQAPLAISREADDDSEIALAKVGRNPNE
jgi:hypothetical protein